MIGLPTPDVIAEICDLAHDEILVRGKAVGALIDGQGRVCMIGAMFAVLGATSDRGWFHPAWQLTQWAIVLTYGRVVAGLNDSTTLDETLDIFRQVAKAARNGGVFTPEAT